jgi:hypothetical protein
MKTRLKKSDYSIHTFFGGYYGIGLKNAPTGTGIIFGGDSANPDNYDLENMEAIFKNWNGKVNEDGYISTEVEPTHRVKHGEIYANTYKTEEFYSLIAAKRYATRKATELNLLKRRNHYWNDETTFVIIEKI